MKYSFILIIFLAWNISGCSFLGFHSDPYGLEDNEEVEENTAEEETYEYEEDEEETEEAEEEEEVSEKRGFFARLMSFGDDDEEDMDMDEEDEEGDYADEEGDEEERSAEEQTGDEQMYADMESYDEDEEMDEDMESYEDEESGEDTTQAAADTGGYYEKSPLPTTTGITKLISVKKIKISPYRRGGFLVNAVYLARPGDTIESVSQKIYGQDRSGDLYSINPHFRSRPLKTGAKVYYSSPQRPNDSSQLLVYYEDIGLPPSYHSLERGQNIRTAARNLLGSPDSWKEIWATNPEIQSKGAAEKTVQLRYWDGSGAPPPPPEPPQEMAQMPEETLPEEPPQHMPGSETAAAPIESPPPMEENFDDPLPEPSSEPSKVGIVETIQKNKLLAIGFIAFIALLLLIIKRIIHKVRDPGDEFDYTKTSIDNNKISI